MTPSRREPASALDDPERLARVREILRGTGPSTGAFDRITQVVTSALGAPVALISIVDDERQSFIGGTGLSGQAAEEQGTPLSHSFCQHVVSLDGPLVISDARENELVADNPAVPELGVTAYAGMPLRVDGQLVGSLCALDQVPRNWTARELETLRRQADLVEYLLELAWPDEPA